jgi:hypothetical protein
MSAAALGAVECVTALIQHDAALDLQCSAGKTAALYAATEGRAEALKALADAGAGMARPSDRDGNTPLSVSGRKVVHSVIDADPSRLFLNDRDYLACAGHALKSALGLRSCYGAPAL